MSFLPDNKRIPLRPEGNFGVQITVAIKGEFRTLWLSGITTAEADIFRTPVDVRLGIPVGEMVQQLLTSVSLETPLPKIIASAQVDRLELRRSGGSSSDFTFGLEVAVNYGDSDDSTLRLWLMLGKANGKASFALKLRLGDPDDPVVVDVALTEEGFFAYLKQSSEPKSFNLSSVGRVVSPDLEKIMGTIEITPLELAIGRHKPSSSYVLAFRLGAEIALSKLPFVGERLPEGIDLSISDLGLVWCSSKVASNQGARTYFEGLPSALITKGALTAGGMFSAMLQVPNAEPQALNIPFKRRAEQITPAVDSATAPREDDITPDNSDPPPGEAPPTQQTTTKVSLQTGASSSDPAKWFDVGKTVGPLSLQRLGLKYADKRVWFLFDTSLSAGAVTLIVDGLGAGIDPFELLGGRFDPKFTLRGLGLVIKGPAEISGAFLRERIPDPRGDYDEFSGVVLVKTQALTISGMGSYADPPWGDPSLFAYAFLDKPIGGPPFFFVTGLALGIAINRNLDLPPIDQVAEFPLVRLALGNDLFPPRTNRPKVRNTNGDAELVQLLEVQQAMKPYTRPQDGQVALAVGVRFTTFQILNSFALLVASFGKPFKLDLLVSSRLQVPALPEGTSKKTKKKPAKNKKSSSEEPLLAQVGIDLRGTWIPADGSLIIEGRITEGSWYLDSACRLSGGAAFASWTSGPHNGDFVMTVGGYHPKFSVPAHYPQVPRLAFNFTRGPVEIKGDAYFAMTPSALMTGGSLSATFNQGNIEAWFNCGADFLVAWEPFNYDATLYVEVGAAYKTIFGRARASVGARLHLWGPDLAGVATVNLKVISFNIKFGGAKKAPQPISAQQFRKRFLPASNAELISINVTDGLVRAGTHEGVPLFVVNPAEFSLAIESVIPKPDGKTIGIGPMGKTALEKKKEKEKEDGLSWKIDKEQLAFKEVEITKPVPAALWGPAELEGQVRKPGFESKSTTIDAIVGYTIKPKDAIEAKGSKEYTMHLLEKNNESWANKKPVWPSTSSLFKKNDKSVKSVLDDIVQEPPSDLLVDLTGKAPDFASEVSLSTDWLADLQELPRVGTL